MNKVFTFFAAVLLTASVILPQQASAQSPEKMSYQAVIRNSSDALVTNQSVGMQISILQGSAGGTAVYVETQTPTTNANGLVSIEIGAGTVVSGDFSTIDWANDSYFIKTETDPTGNTSYSITGTSQLLSVPYALHAKTAETVVGDIMETDPVYEASEAANITATDITNLSNLSGTNTGDQNISGITTNTQAIQDTALQIRAAIPTVLTYSVGDFTQGGVVFYVDESGQHGLVAAKMDQDGGSGILWYNGSSINTEAQGDGIYAGKMNTILVIVNQGSNSNDYAAGVCANYSITENGVTYGDWYLPSKEELILMHQNKTIIDATASANGGSSFAGAYYWSSTEFNNERAWGINFSDGVQYNYLKDGVNYVRAIRAF